LFSLLLYIIYQKPQPVKLFWEKILSQEFQQEGSSMLKKRILATVAT
jgi:hypothetical protein